MSADFIFKQFFKKTSWENIVAYYYKFIWKFYFKIP